MGYALTRQHPTTLNTPLTMLNTLQTLRPYHQIFSKYNLNIERTQSKDSSTIHNRIKITSITPIKPRQFNHSKEIFQPHSLYRIIPNMRDHQPRFIQHKSTRPWRAPGLNWTDESGKSGIQLGHCRHVRAHHFDAIVHARTMICRCPPPLLRCYVAVVAA